MGVSVYVPIRFDALNLSFSIKITKVRNRVALKKKLVGTYIFAKSRFLLITFFLLQIGNKNVLRTDRKSGVLYRLTANSTFCLQ